ncbi:YqiA/YcfP family alpha/beta fold hydrolase [Piscirickettsia litoralis]|uniref:YqiA/YcfP family alpha/beta fold hydrolase n=1 Tax=Piscirickettsia litoralis TaxID=1891921 RepID=UPI002939492F|nr:YqiA/YcfP family alpha/beta fold hydrolase [Piscirickettsia litoralis]
MIGEHVNPYSHEKVKITEDEITQSFRYICSEIKDSERYLVLLQEDDEVLDYRDAKAFFPSEVCHISRGGGHTYTDFADRLPDIEQHIQQ